MKPPLLLLHNYYQQPGGEDQVFAAEGKLLERYGHAVYRYSIHNDQVATYNRLALAQATVWNKSSYKRLREIIRLKRPKVMHVHNTFPLISPSAYYAAKAEGVAVVQTLHNYRLFCPASTFFRDGHACEDCLGKAVPWPGVIHACYRNSRSATSVVAAMLGFHRMRNTWTDAVDAYIALTAFSRSKFIKAGMSPEKIFVKPHFLDPDPGVGRSGNYALFVGRFEPGKGLDTLLSAWDRLGERLPLKIVGDGELAPQVVEAASRTPGLTWLGRKAKDEVYTLMGGAKVLIAPSEYYETFGLVVIEAFAKGTPVIVSNGGAPGELVEHGRTGLHFRTGDPEDLVAQVEWVLSHPAELMQMRKEVRAEYETKYTAEKNYPQLVEIYERAMGVK